jgi:uncharacterized membrane protein
MYSHYQLDTKRIQSLTDATFAVAMTILILEVKVPRELDPEELTAYFIKNVFPELFIYAIGFVTLGIFWIGSYFHHHLMVKTDKISSWLNIIFLLIICLIPFSISFMRNYREEKLSIIFYSLNLVWACIVQLLMLCYAWKKDFTKPEYTRKDFRHALLLNFVPIVCYLLIIPVSFMSTDIATIFFLIPIILHLIPKYDSSIGF